MSSIPISGSPDGLFSLAELRILEHYFEPDNQPTALEEDLRSVLGADRFPSVEAAVARIALEHVQAWLPNWLTRNVDGELVQCRQTRPSSRFRKVLLKPRHAGRREGFGAGPGMGWFMDYYVTWIPLFDRFVVTESDDDGEDRAIGHFRSNQPFHSAKVNCVIAGGDPNLFDTDGEELESGYIVWVGGVFEDDEEKEYLDGVFRDADTALARCREIMDESLKELCIEEDPDFGPPCSEVANEAWAEFEKLGERPYAVPFGDLPEISFDVDKFVRNKIESFYGPITKSRGRDD